MRFLMWDVETDYFIVKERTISKKSPFEIIENIKSTSRTISKELIRSLKEEQELFGHSDNGEGKSE